MILRNPRIASCIANNSLYFRRLGGIRLNSSEASVKRSPTKQYDALVEQKKIRHDDYQREIVSSLHGLYEQLKAYKPTKVTDKHVEKKSFFSRMFSRSNDNFEYKQPKGIYLYGDVGCGKTMLMDMFYTTVPAHLSKKRIHFHSFMQGVHKRSHQLHVEHGEDFDSTTALAHEIAKESNVLCFDEFQVIDVADAMILRRLFDLLYRYGVVTFMTSNRPPDELYKNGLQRASFIPCIEQIKERNKVIFLDSPTDYRKIDRPASGAYFFPPHGKSLKDVKEQADKHVERWFEYFSQGRPVQKNYRMEVWGRPIIVPICCEQSVAQFTFAELCGTPRSVADYLELTRCFPNFILTDIPVLSIRQTDVVRRFITFLDAAYEAHTKLTVTAEKSFEHLFNADDLNDKSSQVHIQAIKNAASDEEDADLLSDGSSFNGAEEKFAFSRTLSRLKQMSSQQWLDYMRL